MNKDLKDFIDKKKSDYLTQITKWETIYKENIIKVDEAKGKIKEFKDLLSEILEDEKLWKLS